MRLNRGVADEPEPEDLPSPEPEVPRPAGGYRVAGGLDIRVHELEQDLVLLRERYKALEREVWTARRVIRKHKAARRISTGGLGATLGTFVALALYAFDVVVSPSPLLATVLLGFVLGLIAGIRWDHEDDFPDAPPPRLL